MVYCFILRCSFILRKILNFGSIPVSKAGFFEGSFPTTTDLVGYHQTLQYVRSGENFKSIAWVEPKLYNFKIHHFANWVPPIDTFLKNPENVMICPWYLVSRLVIVYIHNIHTGIFPGTFQQPLHGSNNSISSSTFSFLFLKRPWKIFHSIHLFFLILFGLDTYKEG